VWISITGPRGGRTALHLATAPCPAPAVPRDATASSAAWLASPKSATPERLSGGSGYPVRVATADVASYQALRDEELATVPR
jgi:hypothetical protein